MLKISKDRILEKLNTYAREALRRASELCIEQSGYEITTGHYLMALIEQPAGDTSKILSGIDMSSERLAALLRKSFEKIKRGSTELPQFSPLLLELLQDAFMLSSGELGEDKVRTGAILIALAQNPERYCHFYLLSEFERMDAAAMTKGFLQLTLGSMEGGKIPAKGASGVSGGAVQSETALEKFCRNITQQAKEGEIDPVFCRDNEIALMSEILCRRRKNNPILVGEPGVGKTALAEGLALKIIQEDVPETIKGATLWELDMGALQAGASVKGEFERRLKGVLDEVLNAAEKIILFIDEAHTLIGGGGQAGGADAANLLKPALARGQLRAIAATTWSEYKKYFEKDPALTRRFQLVKLDEPSAEQCVTILRGLRGAYEETHGVFITDAALHATSFLSERYLTGRQLPDKALDVLDTACVRVAAEQNARPKALEMLERQILMLKQEKADVERQVLLRAQGITGDIEQIDARLKALGEEEALLKVRWEQEKEQVQQIIALRAQLDTEKNAQDEKSAQDIEGLQAKVDALKEALGFEKEEGQNLINYEVGAGIVAQVIADWMGIPAASMSDDDAVKVLTLGEDLRAVIRGQEGAIDIIHDRLKAARLDFVRRNTPRGVFLLVGPSGVGKTETAEQVAFHLFGGRQFLTTINMSEYQEKHTLSRLIGSPPGYVGYGEGGVLTEAIRKKPYSVVLLDEVEKAHSDIMNLFYQAFDKGVINDGEGREIDCKNLVFFMTSNLGSEAIMQNQETVATASMEALEKALRPHLEQHFKPALLARMRILCFKPLDKETIASIITLKLDQQAELLRESRGIALTWDAQTLEQIAALCSHAENGARMIDQVIERWILPPIAEEALERIVSHDPIEEVHVCAKDGGFELTFLPELTSQMLAGQEHEPQETGQD